jgi:hypothetical protein
MSIPVRFTCYDYDGNVLAERTIFTISYGQNSGDLNVLQEHLQNWSTVADMIELHKKYIGETVRYFVPHSAPDYMFDIYDISAILPNKFKHRK